MSDQYTTWLPPLALRTHILTGNCRQQDTNIYRTYVNTLVLSGFFVYVPSHGFPHKNNNNNNKRVYSISEPTEGRRVILANNSRSPRWAEHTVRGNALLAPFLKQASLFFFMKSLGHNFKSTMQCISCSKLALKRRGREGTKQNDIGSSREYRWKRSPCVVVDTSLSVWSRCPWRVQQADSRHERAGGRTPPLPPLSRDRGGTAAAPRGKRELSTLFNMAQFKPEWFEGETDKIN